MRLFFGKNTQYRFVFGQLILFFQYIFLYFFQNNHLENHTITNSKAAKVTSDDNIMEENYSTFALQTHGLIKFVKIAYPDLVISRSPEDLVEPLLEKNKQACRYELHTVILQFRFYGTCFTYQKLFCNFLLYPHI